MSFAESMLDMLTSAYNRTDKWELSAGRKPKTNIGKLFSLAGWGFDILKEQTEKVKLWDDIDYAQGTVLDQYGQNYGVVRGEASDEVYRIMIKVKILAMLAAGNLDTLIYSAASLFGVEAEDVCCDEVFPAKVYLYIDEDKLDDAHKNVAATIAELMNRIKAAGVGLRIFYKTYNVQRTEVYVGTAICMSTFLTALPEPVNKDITKKTNLDVGVGTMICIAVSYPTEQ